MKVTKEKFKEYYFKYGGGEETGWTLDYWNHFYENEDKKEFYIDGQPSKRNNRMFLIDDSDTITMTFLSEDSENSFFNDYDF